MSALRPTTSRLTSRRTTLGAVAGLAVLAGCDDDPGARGPVVGPRTDATGRATDPGYPATSEAPDDDADEALVDEVRTRIRGTLATVVAVRAGQRSLRRRLAPLVRLHEAHLAELAGDDAPDLEPEAGPVRGLAQVKAVEAALQRRLTDAAVAAESGAVARLLASMAAAVAQHRAVLP